MQYIPVVDENQIPLMPTTPAKARKLIKAELATPYWNKGVFCIRLNYTPERVYKQPIAVGVDPGSKREAFTVKSEAHTYINVQTTTPDWVKGKVEERARLRRNRRYRKAPYRANRQNRARGGLPPSTKARWGWKLRGLNWLATMFPIEVVSVEDVKAKTFKNGRKWNESFSPLEVGKEWFYAEIKKRWRLHVVPSFATYEERNELGLRKIGNKLSDSFNTHCVDSWVLANLWTGGHAAPDNTAMVYLYPLKLHRRNLHRQNFSKGGVRRPYGGTNSEGLKRGSWVKHTASGRGKSYGMCYVGGKDGKGRISLHSLETGQRLTQSAKPADCKFLCYASWRTRVAA